MANPVAVPGKEAGEVYIPALGKSFKQVELREDDIFDSTCLPTGSVGTGTELVFFRDITGKNRQHTSLNTPRRIQAGDEAAIFRVGVEPMLALGNVLPAYADYRKVIAAGHMEMLFNRRTITIGPLVKYPSGYGLGGYSQESGATAVSIGVPSAAASPTLFVPQQLKDDDDINCSIFFKDAAGWLVTANLGTAYVAPVLTGPVGLRLFLHGVLKNPLGK